MIVMDPPWVNKSAKRLRTYDYLDENDFKSISVGSLTKSGSLIVVWVTNNSRLKTFVETELFPAWEVEKKAEWTWIKVTKSGAPIYDFHSPHKKPYETIIFARRSQPDKAKRIPDGKIIVSVPSALHSQKPCLKNILKRFLPENPKCLELFARNLTPGWTSWGLEVAKMQNDILFEVEKTPEKYCDAII